MTWLLFLWLLGFAGFALRLSTQDVAFRRTLGLTAPGILLLAGIGALSKQTHQRIVAEDGAVILALGWRSKAPSAGPDSPNLFILHEGTVWKF